MAHLGGKQVQLLDDERPDEYRFKNHNPNHSIAEFVDEYGPGGFYPVTIGDHIASQQGDEYRVLRKLGHGGSGMVWLGQCTRSDKLVALKISKSGEVFLTSKQEASTYIEVEKSVKRNPTAELRYVIYLIEAYELFSPNGSHRCFVFEVMGPSCAQILKNPHFTGTTHVHLGQNRIPLWMAKKMIKALVHSVASIHASGYVHGDVRTPNLLANVKPLTKSDIAALTQDADKVAEHDITHLIRKDGKKDKWAPKHILRGKPLFDMTDYDSRTMDFKLSDLGSAFAKGKPPSALATSISNTPPEVVLGECPTEKCDVWSVGCVIYSILTSNTLFSLIGPEDDSAEEKRIMIDDAMTTFIDTLETCLPSSIASKWPRLNDYYDAKGKKIRHDVEDLSAPLPKPQDIPVWPTLTKELLKHRLHGIDGAEAGEILQLLRLLLSMSPDSRPSMAEVLKNSWVAGLEKA